MVNWTPATKLQWNLNQNATILIQENEYEYIYKIVDILSQTQCLINSLQPSDTIDLGQHGLR